MIVDQATKKQPFHRFRPAFAIKPDLKNEHIDKKFPFSRKIENPPSGEKKAVLKKIVLTGPESTAKSTLARQLAQHFNAEYTEELARTYLNILNRPYEYEDLERIAALQVAAEDGLDDGKSNLLFCDTDLITIKIWSDYRYQRVSSVILEWINQRDYDLYLLCRPDIPWEPDPLRENPENRDDLFDQHVDELNHYNKDFEIVEGEGEDRLDLAVNHVEKYLRFWHKGI
jgi:NadR type nicotinamide-nucleotide adenylyltransferase